MQHLQRIYAKSETSEERMTQLRKKQGLLDTTLVPHAMIILNCTAVEGIPRMLRHRYTENYQNIQFSKISRKLKRMRTTVCTRRSSSPLLQIEIGTPGYEVINSGAVSSYLRI